MEKLKVHQRASTRRRGIKMPKNRAIALQWSAPLHDQGGRGVLYTTMPQFCSPSLFRESQMSEKWGARSRVKSYKLKKNPKKTNFSKKSIFPKNKFSGKNQLQVFRKLNFSVAEKLNFIIIMAVHNNTGGSRIY